MQNRHGLTLQLSYTYGHEIDIQSGDLTSTNQQGSGGQLSDPFNTDYDRGSGTIDRRNIFNANYIYNFPSFQDRDTAMRVLLGGWQFSGVTVAQSGNPVNVTYSPDTLGLGGSTTNRPNFDRQQQELSKKAACMVQYWCLFSLRSLRGLEEPIRASALPDKDSIVGPGLFNWNLSLFKELRHNHGRGSRDSSFAPSPITPSITREFNGIDTGFTDSNFGQVTSTYDPRTWQFGGKFIF